MNLVYTYKLLFLKSGFQLQNKCNTQLCTSYLFWSIFIFYVNCHYQITNIKGWRRNLDSCPRPSFLRCVPKLGSICFLPQIKTSIHHYFHTVFHIKSFQSRIFNYLLFHCCVKVKNYVQALIVHDRVQNFSGSGLFSVEVSGSGSIGFI